MEKNFETYYSRQMILPEIGKEGLEKLRLAKVLVIGAGGLGCAVLEQLCGSGIGTIGVVDNDLVSYSNLHRQSLYTQDEIGELKVFCASRRLIKRNPHVQINVYPQRLNTQNALLLIEDYDIVVDCTDNYGTRYLINDACAILKKPFVYGALYRFQGQVAVFNDNDGPTYRCLNPEFPAAESSTDCVNSGVISVIPSLVGNLQALETVKWILQEKVLSKDLLVFDFKTISLHRLSLPERKTDYSFLDDGFDHPFYTEDCELSFELRIDDFESFIKEGKIDEIVDVRERSEVSEVEAVFKNEPLSVLQEVFPESLNEVNVLFLCRSGQRSKLAAQIAQKKGNGQYFSLKDGISKELIELWKNRK